MQIFPENYSKQYLERRGGKQAAGIENNGTFGCARMLSRYYTGHG